MAYVGKITDTNNVTGKVASTLLGTCDTGAGTADKVVDCVWFDTLMLGVEIRVWFSAGNTAANPTLNVNNTGALPIYNGHNMSRPSSQISSWDAGEIVSFTYISIAGGASGWWMNNRRRDLDNAKFFAVCSETAESAWKTITVDGLSELNVGTKITVLFTYGNTVNNVLSGKLPIRVIGDDGLDTGNNSMANSVIETSPILDAGTVVTLVCTSTVANAIKWRVVASETVQSLTSTSGQLHPLLMSANTGSTTDVPNTSSSLYKTRCTPNILFPAYICASDGGALTSKYLYNYMVFESDKYELLASAPADWTTKWFTYYTKSGSTYSSVTGNQAPSFQTNTYYKLKYDSTSGYMISANQFGNVTRRNDGSMYNGPLVKGYSGKSSASGDGGQLTVVGGNGLTIVSGGEYGDSLTGMIDDYQGGYVVTTSQPSNWSTNYKNYFRKVGSYYVRVNDDTAPTWAASTFYYGPDRLFLFTDSTGNPNTAVGAGLRGDSDSLVLASDGAIFFVAPAGTVSDKYDVLLSEPRDWSSAWETKYKGTVCTVSGGVYSAVTSDSAPTFQVNSYYMPVEIRRGIYFHPGSVDYSSPPRFVPSENGTAVLGTNSTHWKSAYIDTVYGALSGNATSADYATSAGTAASATSADSATYATSAGSASTADSATYATSAGSAASATSAGSATNATYFDLTDDSTTYSGRVVYREPGSNKSAMSNNAFLYAGTEGTSSSEGNSTLILGNAVRSGVDSNNTGVLCLYSAGKSSGNAGCVNLKSDNTSDNVTVTIPSKINSTLALKRVGSIYMNWDHLTTPWGKVASDVVSGQTTHSCIIIVNQGLGTMNDNNYNKACGILQISCGTNPAGTANSNTSRLIWLTATANIDKSNFVLVAKNGTPTSDDVTYELWVKVSARYHPWTFTILNENYAANVSSEFFTLYDVRDTSSSAGNFVASCPASNITNGISYMHRIQVAEQTELFSSTIGTDPLSKFDVSIPNFDRYNLIILELKITSPSQSSWAVIPVKKLIADCALTASDISAGPVGVFAYHAVAGDTAANLVTAFSLTGQQPTNWANDYDTFFTRTGSNGSYKYTPIPTGSAAPTWAASTYYQTSARIWLSRASSTGFRINCGAATTASATTLYQLTANSRVRVIALL